MRFSHIHDDDDDDDDDALIFHFSSYDHVLHTKNFHCQLNTSLDLFHFYLSSCFLIFF